MTEPTPELKIKVIEHGFTVPTWMLEVFDRKIKVPATEADQVIWDTYRDDVKAWKASRVEHYNRARAISKGYLRDLAELHAPTETNTCDGCDIDGYECESPAWPCRTADIILAANGFNTPHPERPEINWRGTGRRENDELRGAISDLVSADLAEAIAEISIPKIGTPGEVTPDAS